MFALHGFWRACFRSDGSRLDWFFCDKETAQKFTSALSPLKFTGPGQENGESFQRWRVSRRVRASGQEVPFDMGGKAAGNKLFNSVPDPGGAAAATLVDPTEKSLQVSAKVGCLSVGLYTQQQYLAVLLRIYEARLYLKKKRKDARLKAKVGEFFMEHAKARDAQRRSIVLCKKVVHIGGQCRRFCLSPGTEAASSPVHPSEDSDPAALIRAEIDHCPCDSRQTSRQVSPRLQRLEAWGPSKLQVPADASELRQRFSTGRRPTNNRGSDRERSPRNRSSDGLRALSQSPSPPEASCPSDDNYGVSPLQVQLRQHPKPKLELQQQLKEGSGQWTGEDGEQHLSSNPVLRSQQVHAAGLTETLGNPAISPPLVSEQESECATLSDLSDRMGNAFNQQHEDDSLCFSEETEEQQSLPPLTCLHSVHGRPRHSLLQGHSIPADAELKNQEKPPIPELVRQARPRAVGATLRMHHYHRGLPWHWKSSGNADNSQAEEANNASQGRLTSQSSIAESEKPNGGFIAAGQEAPWLTDVVGQWTLRDEPDGDLSSRTGGRRTPVGHDCCFGAAGAPLNLLLFEDNDISRKGTSRNKRKTKARDVGIGKQRDGTKKIDQMALSLHLQPELKSTEAQLCVQSLHAFPTANLLCCLTDSALCLKSLWNEESIRARCLIACLLGDVRSQKAAQTAGLNLKASGESEVKEPPRRRFTLNRRLSRQQRDDKYSTSSNRGSESGSDTSSYSGDSAPEGTPRRALLRLRKQAKTTFSRRGAPDSLSDPEEDLLGGAVSADGLRRANRSISGGRRRRRSHVHASKERRNNTEAARARNHQVGVGASGGGGLPSVAAAFGAEAASDSTDRLHLQQQQKQQRQQEQTAAPSAEAAIGAAGERRGSQPQTQAGVSVSVEVVLEDVTCNLLTDDAAATLGAEDMATTEAGGVPGVGCGHETERSTVHPTYVSSQDQHGKQQELLRSRRRQGQTAAVSSSSNKPTSSNCNRDISSTASTASTDEGPGGGDAGLAFPPYPMLFSPDVCVPEGSAALGEGLLGDSSLRRAVVADAAALGLRLEAVMRVTYTSVPTGNSSGNRKREELKDTLRVGLWRLEATLVRNCTWTLASLVLFDANLGAECLRLLPPKKRRAAAGPARAGSKGAASWRSAAAAEPELPYWGSSRLNTVAENTTENEGDTPAALRKALWAAESRGDNRGGELQSRRNPKPHPLGPWEQKRETGGLPEGYVSADGSLQAARYEKKGRGGAYEGLQEGAVGGGSPRGLARRRDSCADGDSMRRRFSVGVPRRLPSSGSSSLFRWVFGSRNTQNSALAPASPMGSSPQMGYQMQPAAEMRGPPLADLDSSLDRRDAAPEPTNYTDGEMYFAGYQPDAGVTVRPKQQQQPAAATGATAAVTSPTRWGATAGGWTRNLLRTRRSISTLNSGEQGRQPSSPPPKGRDGGRYPFEGEGALASGPLQSPDATRQANRRSSGRPLVRPPPQQDSNLSTLRSTRAFSAMPRWEEFVCCFSSLARPLCLCFA